MLLSKVIAMLKNVSLLGAKVKQFVFFFQQPGIGSQVKAQPTALQQSPCHFLRQVHSSSLTPLWVRVPNNPQRSVPRLALPEAAHG